MKGFLEIASQIEHFRQVVESLKNGERAINICGVSGSVVAHIAFCLCEHFGKPALVVTSSEATAKEIYQDLCFFFGKRALYFQQDEVILFRNVVAGREVFKKQLVVLDALCNSSNAIVVSSVESLFGKVISKSVLLDEFVEFRVGHLVDYESVSEKLVQLGYLRRNSVEVAGEFSARGGIFDFFPYTSDNPYRVELFANEVSSIREFCVENQRSVTKLDYCKAPLAIGDDAHLVDFFDYLTEHHLVFLHEQKKIYASATVFEKQLIERYLNISENTKHAKTYNFCSWQNISSSLQVFPIIAMSALPQNIPNCETRKIIQFGCKDVQNFYGNQQLLIELLTFYKKNDYKSIVLAADWQKADKLAKTLTNQGIVVSCTKSLDRSPKYGEIILTVGSIKHGFEYIAARTVVIIDGETVLRSKNAVKQQHKTAASTKAVFFSDLNIGDYVVHNKHGIGQYKGIKTLEIEELSRDYITITYRGGDNLYLPVDQMNSIYRYLGAEKADIKLNKLGGTEWAATKRRAKKACEDIAKELIEIYAERTRVEGIAFSPDSEWQKDFEASFPYEETEDQLKSADEIKSDMEQKRPMDRLLCGDVGYGKTEVAMRAAFKAVVDGYQVVCLVPTTVLASQHYKTFKERMSKFPFKIEFISRFKTPMQQKAIIEKIRSGEIDIIIGTHKILNKNIRFKKLGLLIVDEEQRFGVTHKEKFKGIWRGIDVLTLSATPIPRTLHMSMTGIRDISILAQPPKGRYPIATYILEHDEEIVKYAINRELDRNGQTFYLFNNINGIYKVALTISKLVPQARVVVAHGQMSEQQLEDIMVRFAEGEIDVLVCTTIIEAGLDMPNVNTIIIENADKMGLAQLYQLRGRVGRANRFAYAYFMFKKDKILSETAEKRLLAVKEFAELGSGIKIAMRDLEIRGAGSVIGARQHGHMAALGYEMYCKILHETVQQLLGQAVKQKTETLVNLKVQAHISKYFIPSTELRVETYKKIAAIESEEDLERTYEEIRDRYGTVPESVHNLMQIALIKHWASQLDFTEISDSEKKLKLYFSDKSPPDFKKILQATENGKYNLKINAGQKPNCEITINAKEKMRNIDVLKQLLLHFNSM